MEKYWIYVLRAGVVGLASWLGGLTYDLIRSHAEAKPTHLIYAYMVFAIVVLLIVGLFAKRDEQGRPWG